LNPTSAAASRAHRFRSSPKFARTTRRVVAQDNHLRFSAMLGVAFSPEDRAQPDTGAVSSPPRVTWMQLETAPERRGGLKRGVTIIMFSPCRVRPAVDSPTLDVRFRALSHLRGSGPGRLFCSVLCLSDPFGREVRRILESLHNDAVLLGLLAQGVYLFRYSLWGIDLQDQTYVLEAYPRFF
jgi:hypothetical protein